MGASDDILLRLGDLIAEASEMFRHSQVVVPALWDAWRVSALSVVAQLTGETSEYYTSLAVLAKLDQTPDRRPWSPQRPINILKRVRDDYAKGYLRDLRELAAAEVFTDFLDMADYLHTKGYHIPAASLSGAVVEESLRRLHLKQVGPWQGDSSISKLNNGLYKADVYGLAVFRQVQVWGDIRNDADHGDFGKVDPGAVKAMVSGIRDFIAKHEA
jgi:hypothetical protein